MAKAAKPKKKKSGSPVDFKKVMEAMDELEAARGLPVYVNLVLDVTASDELLDCVLEAFEASVEEAHVNQLVFAGEVPELPLPCDLCVVVGGESLLLGSVASASRRMGCPTPVLIEAGETYFTETWEEADEITADYEDVPEEGVPVDDIVELCLEDERPLEPLGKWVAKHAPAKRASLAEYFPFIRHPLGVELTELIALQNAAVGLVFLVPGADMPIITLNQVKLVLQIASVYGQPLDTSRALDVAAVVAGAFGFRALARELSEAIPILGWGIKGTIAYTGTLSVGTAALDYFEEGGRINGLAKAIKRAVDDIAAKVEQSADGVDSDALASEPLEEE